VWIKNQNHFSFRSRKNVKRQHRTDVQRDRSLEIIYGHVAAANERHKLEATLSDDRGSCLNVQTGGGFYYDWAFHNFYSFFSLPILNAVETLLTQCFLIKSYG
jgi:hypothetical protein